MTRRVLFAPIHNAALLEMLPVARRLQQEGRFEPVFFLFREVPAEQVRRLQTEGLRVIGPLAERAGSTGAGDPPAATAPPAPPDQGAHQDSGRAYGWKHTLQNGIFPGALINLARLARLLRRARRLLAKEQVAALVTIGDRHVGWETALIRAGQERGIPALIVPYTLSDPQGAAQYRLRLPDVDCYRVSGLARRWLAGRYPQWVHSAGDGERLFFSPPGVGLAAQALGMMAANPWTIGGGSAACMAVENEHLRGMFLEQGVPAGKMVVTGKPSTDAIYAELQRATAGEVRAELHLRPGERLLLLSVPHLGEHGLLPWDQHWREMDFLFTTLSRAAARQGDVRLALSLHPKSKPEDYQALADRCGAILARRRIYELLPACDLFVSNYSGTVMVAAGLAKPVVVIDFYGLDYTYFDREPGMVVLREREKLAPTLDRLLGDPDAYRELAAAQAQRAPAWISLDGRCTTRVVERLERVIGE